MSALYIRKATKAGSWYTEESKKLSTELSSWLTKAEEDYKEPVFKNNHHVKAVIMPHAGYSYSGPTAAYSAFILKHLKGLKKIFILGPSHRYYLRNLGVFDSVSCDTPLGELKVDTHIVKTLSLSKLVEKLPRSVDEREHSIEMMLPFVRHVLGDNKEISIIPILVGSIDEETVPQCAKLLSPYFEQPNAAFIISSDFCHWGRGYSYCKCDGVTPISSYVQKLDFEGLQYISQFDSKKFASYLARTGNTICGRNPIQVLLALCDDLRQRKKFGLSCDHTKYTQSTMISSCSPQEEESLVAYVAAIIRVHF